MPDWMDVFLGTFVGLMAGIGIMVLANKGSKTIPGDSEVKAGFIAPKYLNYRHYDIDGDKEKESVLFVKDEPWGVVFKGKDSVPYLYKYIITKPKLATDDVKTDSIVDSVKTPKFLKEYGK